MVVKLKTAVYSGDFCNTYHRNSFYMGSQHNNEKKIFPLGKVTLSCKVGKKRKLVKGFMKVFPESSSDTGLWREYVFTPSSPTQFDKMKRFING